MGTKQRDNNGCFFPFGNNFLTLFGLMVLDDEVRRNQEEIAYEEDDDFVTDEAGEFENDEDIEDENEDDAFDEDDH